MFHVVRKVSTENSRTESDVTDHLSIKPGDIYVVPTNGTYIDCQIQLMPKDGKIHEDDGEKLASGQDTVSLRLDMIARGKCYDPAHCSCMSLLEEICMDPAGRDANGNYDKANTVVGDPSCGCNENNCCSDVFKQIKAENEELKVKMAQTHAKLMLVRNENAKLQERSKKEYNDINNSLYTILQQYCDVGQCFERSKIEIKELSSSLMKEQEESAQWKKKYLDLKQKVEEKSFTNPSDDLSVEGADECSLPEDDKLETPLRELRVLTPSPSNQDLSLSCTLCFEKLSLDELERHSKNCSAGVSSQPATPSLPGMLVANVTRCSTDSQQEGVFKIVTKTTLPSYNGTFFQVQRGRDDFLWIWNKLQASCQELVVPPLDLPEHIHGALRGMQRFLRRACSHRLLKENADLRNFLTATTKDFEKAKKSAKKKRHHRRQFSCHKPSKEGKSQDGMLIRSQRYIGQLQEKLEDLKSKLKETLQNTTNDEISKCFEAISQGEENGTFLQMAATALTKVARDGTKDELESDAAVLIENLGSLISYTKCAQGLLSYVSSIIDTFLYWEEEMEVYEEMEKQGSITSSNGVIVTKKWAEASAKCSEMKGELERVCSGLSDELFWFDFQKEQELKEIFQDYAEGRAEQFEKLKSKWYSLKLILDTEIDFETRAINFHGPSNLKCK